VKLKRAKSNPILSPSSNWWENTSVFNPGVTIFNKKILLLYRAKGNDYISRFGLAVSGDGVNFKRFSKPIFEGSAVNPFERLGVEDPRITKIGEEYFIFYTGASVYPLKNLNDSKAPSLSRKAPWRVRTFLIKTTDFEIFSPEQIALHLDSKDSALFPEKINGRYLLFHRIYPNMYLVFSNNLQHWGHNQLFLTPRRGKWDSERVGVGSPPLKTEKGWLCFYHGVSQDHVYRLGVLLLDLKNPFNILYRSDEPILEPKEPYETKGCVNNVVFTCGAVEKDGQYFVYYGAADTVIGLATIGKKELLNSLI